MSESDIVPIHDPNRRWTCWNSQEIYMGEEGHPGRYIPNPGDLVIDWNEGLFRVASINLNTGKSELIYWTIPKQRQTAIEENHLIGVDIAAQGESYRVYLDTSVIPHTLAIDSRLHVYGTTAHSVKLFQGYDISDNGTIISAMYDGQGNFLGENIPLELVAMPEQNNVGIKTPMVGYTLKELPDGEIVTAVVYDDAGYAISYSSLLVKNTAFVRRQEAQKKYVASIRLESPFMDASQEKLLRLPMNLNVEDLPATGVVTYSDGSVQRHPIFGGPFRLYGLDHYIASIIGQKIPLVLTYVLGEGEQTYSAESSFAHHISENYWATTTSLDPVYTLRLFAYPEWLGELRGYRLNYYLMNLERTRLWDVTSKVRVENNSATFEPFNFGSQQQLIVSVDVNDVDARYPHYRHVQTLDITLLSEGFRNTDNWEIRMFPNQDPPYGRGLSANIHFINVDNWELDISCGAASEEDWLRKVYYATDPLVHCQTETDPPAPNYLIVHTKRREYPVPVNLWNEKIIIVNDLEQGENIQIDFIHRFYEQDLLLSTAQLPVHLT